MSPSDDGITPAVLLQHMQAMEQRLVVKIEDVRTELKSDIGRVETNLNRVEENLNRVEGKVDLTSVQIGNLDERLDTIEVVQMPALQKAIGI